MLFVGLFVVNDAFKQTGAMDAAVAFVRTHGADPARPAALFGLSVVLSNRHDRDARHRGLRQAF